ncbi:MAG: hypothetical protein KDB00_20660, partial [Planctomycetales bacterium]|nr:hypothetical protein [Planctomycetales bacterium]
VVEALCHCQIDPITAQLKGIYAKAEPSVASAVGLILATHRESPTPNRLSEFFDHEDPAVRARAWETVIRSVQ